jgi:hypothetical protein
MVAILPKCAAMMLAAVIGAGEAALKLLHHPADSAFFRFNGKFVSVIGGNAEIQQRYPELFGCQPESLAIGGAVAGKFEKKGAIVATMSQMTDHSRQLKSIRSRHRFLSGSDEFEKFHSHLTVHRLK